MCKQSKIKPLYLNCISYKELNRHKIIKILHFNLWANNEIIKQCIFAPSYAGVVKLADTLDLGSSAVRLGGSSPFTRTSFLALL